jgi:hypothetical protein
MRPVLLARRAYQRGYQHGSRAAYLELVDAVANACAMSYLDGRADAGDDMDQLDEDRGALATSKRLGVAQAMRVLAGRS